MQWTSLRLFVLTAGLIALTPRLEPLLLAQAPPQSLAAAAERLRDCVRNWLQESGAEKVNIVAHSFGGLVARAYIEAHGGHRVVDWLVTLGTPHKGMFKTFKAVHSGLQVFTFSPAQTKRTSRTFPSAYELLPSDAKDGMFTFKGSPANPMTAVDWSAPELRPHLAEAHRTVSALLPVDLRVNACLIFGTRLETLAAAKGTAGDVTFETREDGDGTVPEVSGNGSRLRSAKKLHRFAVAFGRHMSLFAHEDVQRDLLRPILLGEKLPAARLFVAFSQEPFFQPQRDNLLVAALSAADGTPIDGATVELTIEGTGIRERALAQDPERRDYVAKVRMPGSGQSLRYEVTAQVPGISTPLSRTGLLVSTRS